MAGVGSGEDSRFEPPALGIRRAVHPPDRIEVTLLEGECFLPVLEERG